MKEVAIRTANSAAYSARLDSTVSQASKGTPRGLAPLADTIAGFLVFAPATQSSFVVAIQGDRLLMDVGRVDTKVTSSPERTKAYRLAVEARSPVARGGFVRVRGPWGPPANASIDSFDVANGRVVAVLGTVPARESVPKSSKPLVGLAELVRPAGTGQLSETMPSLDSAVRSTPPEGDRIGRDSTACTREWNDATRVRAAAVRDSLELALRTGEQPVYARLRSSLRVRRSMIPGCFRDGSAVIAVALYGGDYEWTREKVVLLTRTGGARLLSVRDFRLRAHELLDAFDADDDGFDDIAARGFTTRAGAQVVLRFTGQRLERIAAGFAWER